MRLTVELDLEIQIARLTSLPYENFAAIIMHLEDLASGIREDINAQDVSKIQGYLKKMKTHKFVSTNTMLSWIQKYKLQDSRACKESEILHDEWKAPTSINSSGQ